MKYFGWVAVWISFSEYVKIWSVEKGIHSHYYVDMSFDFTFYLGIIHKYTP